MMVATGDPSANHYRTLAILREGRARIKRGWCQRALALDRYGHMTDPASPTAVAWCIIGAVDVDSGALIALREADEICHILDHLNDEIYPEGAKGQQAAIALYDAAIARLTRDA